MDITSLTELTPSSNGYYEMIEPHLIFRDDIALYTYEVQKFEEMRIDSVMMSIYNDVLLLPNADIILYLNGIDNPLNIMEGDILYYPESSKFDLFRLEPTKSSTSTSIAAMLSTPNKTTQKDNNRINYLQNGYSLPPVVLEESTPPITLDNGKVLVGGIN